MQEILNDLNSVTRKEVQKSVFELDPNVEKFGGVQKFVLAQGPDGYIIGSLPNSDHTAIAATMNLDENFEIFGGGIFQFSNGVITLDSSFHTSKLGPIKISFEELKEIFQNIVGNKYKIEISD